MKILVVCQHYKPEAYADHGYLRRTGKERK